MSATLKRPRQCLDLLDAVVGQGPAFGLSTPVGVDNRIGRQPVRARAHRIVEDCAHELPMLVDRPRGHPVDDRPGLACRIDDRLGSRCRDRAEHPLDVPGRDRRDRRVAERGHDEPIRDPGATLPPRSGLGQQVAVAAQRGRLGVLDLGHPRQILVGELAEADSLTPAHVGIAFQQPLTRVVLAHQLQHAPSGLRLGEGPIGRPATARIPPAITVHENPRAAERPDHRRARPVPLAVPERPARARADERPRRRAGGRGEASDGHCGEQPTGALRRRATSGQPGCRQPLRATISAVEPVFIGFWSTTSALTCGNYTVLVRLSRRRSRVRVPSLP
jgi:hypothetical protein